MAHDGRIIIDLEILVGKTPEHAPAHVRIERIDPINAVPGAESALLIEREVDGQFRTEQVSVGQIVSLDDFDKLRWNAEGNDGGQFSFVPLDGAQKVIEGVPEQKISIHEHLPVPVYDPAAMTVYVSHDQVRTIAPALLDGTDPARQPAGVRILGIQPGAPAPADAAPLLLDGQPVQAEQWIPREDFGKLRWHAAQGTGGSFRFVPTNADGTSILGADPQTITLTEDPLPPVYNDAAAPLVVAHDGTRKIDPLRLTGTDIGRKPDYIRITAIDENGASGQTPTALQRFLPAGSTPGSSTGGPGGNADGNNTGAPNGSTTGSHPGTPGGSSNDSGSAGALPAPGASGSTITLGVGSIVPFAAFRHLSWNADGNDGGSFSFVPSTADGRPLEGATEQQVRIVEDPLPPVYPPASEPLVVAHDGMQAIGAMRLTGADIKRKPDYIRITAIDENGHDGPPSALRLPGEIDASGQVTGSTPILLGEGSIVPFAAFRHLSWDAQGNEGGRFSFVPSTADGRPLEGATEQHLQIRESSIPPDYSAPSRLDVPHEQAAALPASLLGGQDASHAPARILIQAIELNEAPAGSAPLPADAASRSLFILQDDGERRYLSAGQSVDRQDFERLHWDGATNAGGSFSIEPREADGEAIIGAQARTITVVEHPVPPQYEASHLIQLVASDARISIGRALFAAENHSAPDHVRIDGIDVDQGEADHAALVHHGVPVRFPLVLSRADADSLHWDASGNQGGSVRFTPSLADGTPILGAAPQQLMVHESPLPPVYGNTPSVGMPHEGSAFLPSGLFTGSDPQRAPAHVYITAIRPHADADGSPANAPALWLDRDGLQGAPGTALLPSDRPIPLADLDHLRWDARHNQGGELVFTPLDEARLPILGSDGRTIAIRIGVHESPQAPDYSSPARQVLTHDKAAQPIDARVFAGANPQHAPAHIRIEAITENGDGRGDESALWYRQDDGSIVRVHAQDTLSRDQYNRLHWDADSNQGGSIRFSALDGERRPIVGSQDQSLQLSEDLPAPAYPAALPTLSLAAGGTLQFSPEHGFAGTDPARTPPAIRITAIEENGVTGQPPASLVMRNPDGTEQAVTVGQTIALTEVPRLYWKGDADAGDGGRIRFVPTHADGTQILGSEEAALTIFEHPQAPDYPDSQPLQVVAHDGTLTLERSLFAGSDSQREPERIRILSVDPALPPGTALPLGLRPDDAPGSVPVPVTVGQDISRSEFGRLVWNAAGNAGGSFRFVAMVADSRAPDGMEPIAGSPVQTITVHESPLPPHYAAQTEPTRIAHNSEIGFALSRLAGVVGPSDSTVSPSTRYIRITAITEQADQDTSASPLYLKPANGQEPYTSITQGSEIAVEDLPRLFWHSANNEGGSFRFIPLDAGKHEILGAREQQVQVYESPQAPSYSANHQTDVSVPHDTTHTLSSRLFNGDSPHLAPAYIRIESVHESEGSSGGPSPLVLHRGENGQRELGANSIVAQADFAALSWDASRNDGGHFLFRALDHNQIDIVGSQPMRVNLQEQPPSPPAYAGYNVDTRVGNGQILSFERSMFVGSDEKLAPSAVWIHSLVENGDTAAEQPALMIDRGLASARPVTLVQGSMVLSAAEFDKLSWDTSTNNGGSFVFAALDKHNKLIPNGRPQTVTVTESPLPPSYPEQAPQVGVANQSSKLLDATLFTGSDQNRKPAAIRITAITPDSPTAGGHALTLDPDGNGSQPASAVRVDQVIALADLGKLSWNAAHNSGGRFSFVALDSSNQPIIGSPEQHVNVHESPVAPTYLASTSSAMSRGVAYNTTAEFTTSTLGGAKTSTYPAYVRITAINEQNDTSPGASPLSLKPPQGSAGITHTPVNVGTEIPRSDFHRLVWSTTHNQGGNFQFIALDSQRRPIEGSAPQTVTINESPQAPTYENNEPRLSVGYDQTLSLRRELFAGSKPDFEPYGIRIDEMSPRNGTLGLYLDRGTGTMQALRAGSVVERADLDKIHWDASKNDGGSFRFTAMENHTTPIRGPQAQVRVQLEEGPSYTPTENLRADYDQPLNIGATVFQGNRASHSPTAVRITAIDQPFDQNPANSPLYINHAGSRTYLNVGDSIAAADFGKVQWDAAGSDGGSFSFQALDRASNVVHGTPTRTITISESGPVHSIATAGTTADTTKLSVGLDAYSLIGEHMLATRPGAGNSNRWFRIEPTQNIEAFLSNGGNRFIDFEASSLTAYEIVRVSSGLTRAEADSQAQRLGGQLLNIDTNDEGHRLNNNLFQRGTTLNEVHHANSNPGSRLGAFVVEYADYEQLYPLRLLDKDDPTNLSKSQPVYNNQVVGNDGHADELSRLIWYSQANQGGTLRFTEVQGREQIKTGEHGEVINGPDGNPQQDPDKPGNRQHENAHPHTFDITENGHHVPRAPKSLKADDTPVALKSAMLFAQDAPPARNALDDLLKRLTDPTPDEGRQTGCKPSHTGTDGTFTSIWRNADVRSLLDVLPDGVTST